MSKVVNLSHQSRNKKSTDEGLFSNPLSARESVHGPQPKKTVSAFDREVQAGVALTYNDAE
jgi:hypothetical protein